MVYTNGHVSFLNKKLCMKQWTVDTASGLSAVGAGARQAVRLRCCHPTRPRPVPTPFRRSPTERKRRGQLDPPHQATTATTDKQTGAGRPRSRTLPHFPPRLASPSSPSPHLLLPPPSAHAAFTREEEQHSELRGLGRNRRARVFRSLARGRPGGAEGRNRAGSAECDVSS
jgi:hypothetical protein